jgi:hypothetical protein
MEPSMPVKTNVSDISDTVNKNVHLRNVSHFAPKRKVDGAPSQVEIILALISTQISQVRFQAVSPLAAMLVIG